MAKRPEIDPRLRGTPAAYLHCRRYGHHWDPPDDTDKYEVDQYGRGGKIVQVSQTLECRTCTTTVDCIFAYPSFDPVKRVPHYAKGYLVHDEGRPRLRRGDAHFAAFTQQLSFDLDVAAEASNESR